MTCSACSLGIEKNLNKQNGVVNAVVSLMDESMLVEFDDNVISEADICNVVSKLGYSAAPYEKEKKQKRGADKLLIRFLSSLILLLPLLYFSMGHMAKFPLPSLTANYIVQFVLTTIILVINYKFFTNGSRAVWHRAPNMDTLVALGAAASYIFSVVEIIIYFADARVPDHIFFESAAMVVTLVTLGKWLEDKSKRRTGREIEKLSKFVPDTVVVIKDGKETTVPSSSLTAGDVLSFRAGDYIAVDGTVTEGNAFLDKSALTGESMPEEVSVGKPVTSGSIMKSGYITVRAEKTGDDTLFAKIIETVREAGASKAPVQKFADKVAGVFVPVVTVIAVLTFIVWIAVTKDVYRAFNFGISVLVVSCPCALGLATPVAVMAATGKAASLGVLYKDAEALQKSDGIDCILLDKTATITVGQPKVIDVRYFCEDKALVLSVAAAIEGKSNHPIAECIREYCGETDKVADNYDYLVGKGATATVDGVNYRLGNLSLVGNAYENIAAIEEELSADGGTAVFMAGNDKLLAVFTVADYIKDDSKMAIAALNDKNITTVMLTGDNKNAARAVAEQAGITEFVAEVLPADKAAEVKKYIASGRKTAMVGDGINDSPALKSADLGIAIGTGTDIAIDSADIVLMNGSLTALVDTVELGKKSVGIIKGNLFWAFFYNVLAIPVAAGALSTVGVSLTPPIAAACMSLSSLFVVLNALRITAYKPHFGNGKKLAEDNNNDIEKGEKNMNKKTVIIKGMMCMHCVAHVTDALKKIEGVKEVEVDLKEEKAVVVSDEKIADDKIIAAVTDAGYEVAEIK